MTSEAPPVTKGDIREAIEHLDIAGSSVCLHSSLSSVGRIDGGPDAVIDAFLEAGCTLLAPTFTAARFEVAPRPDQLLPRNGWDYVEAEQLPHRSETVFDPRSNEVDENMGTLPAALLQRAERLRGNHPLNSFAAIGPKAKDLIEEQDWNDVYAPLRELTKQSGYVVLAGVGLDRMTILHLAETLAGRRLFRRWATGSDGEPVAVPVGSCSDGFPKLAPMIGMLAAETTVGDSRWRAFPAAETVTSAAAVIRTEPEITRCDDPECIRCPDAIAGGPRV